MTYILTLIVLAISSAFWPSKWRDSIRAAYWHAIMGVNRITGGFLAARASVESPMRAGAWAALRRAGIKFPGSFVTLPSLDPKVDNYANVSKRCNRFLAHQVLRLERAAVKRDSRLFWTIALMLIRRSKVYRMAAVHKSIPFWYYKLTTSRFRTLLMTIEAHVSKGVTKMETDRKYIPKADGIRVRSLGVPRLEWRVILTMWTVMLTLWLQPLISPSQYGARPGVGVAHAWREILEKALSSDFIYEFDLAGFFNTIRLRNLHRLLEEEAKLPSSVNQFIFRMNQNDPIPPEEGVHPSDPELAETDPWTTIRTNRKWLGPQLTPGHWPDTKATSRYQDVLPYDDVTAPNNLREVNWRKTFKSGITQGTNWGPILAVFALEHSGLFNPISMPKGLRRAELAEYRDAIMNEEFVIDPLTTDARTAHHREDLHRMAVERIMDSEGWDIHLVQFIDDGVWYGSMAMPCEEWFGPVPEGEVDEGWDSVGPGQLLDISSTNFSALGLKFSDKESVQGLLKCYGKWRKPLTYLGITYDPASDVLSGPQGVTIKREKLLRILTNRGFEEFQRVITGMCPGQHSCAPTPLGASNKEVLLKSPLAKYCQDWRLGSFHYGHVILRHSLLILPVCWFIWGGWTPDGGVVVPLVPVLLTTSVSVVAWDWILPGNWSRLMVASRRWEWFNIDIGAASTHLACAYLQSSRPRPKPALRQRKKQA